MLRFHLFSFYILFFVSMLFFGCSQTEETSQISSSPSQTQNAGPGSDEDYNNYLQNLENSDSSSVPYDQGGIIGFIEFYLPVWGPLKSGHYRSGIDLVLLHNSTGETFKAKTNERGFYFFRDLYPGYYSIQSAFLSIEGYSANAKVFESIYVREGVITVARYLKMEQGLRFRNFTDQPLKTRKSYNTYPPGEPTATFKNLFKDDPVVNYPVFQ